MELRILALCVLAFVAAGPKKVQRVAAPKDWPKFVSSTFVDDAFALLEGPRPKSFESVEDKPKKEEKEKEIVHEANGDFDRRDMMKKLKSAEESLSESLNNQKTFVAGSAKVDSSADLLIMMGRTLFNSDPDFNDQDSYLKQAEEMTNNAKKIKIFVKKGDYEGAARAFADIKKSCDACHAEFR